MEREHIVATYEERKLRDQLARAKDKGDKAAILIIESKLRAALLKV